MKNTSTEVIEQKQENLSSKMNDDFTDEPDSVQVTNLKQEIKDSFNDHPDQVTTVRKIVDRTGYSNVRVNNICNELLEDKYVTRAKANGRFYYKRNVVETTSSTPDVVTTTKVDKKETKKITKSTK